MDNKYIGKGLFATPTGVPDEIIFSDKDHITGLTALEVKRVMKKMILKVNGTLIPAQTFCFRINTLFLKY